MGAPQDVIESARKRLPDNDDHVCEVWEENWRSVLLFLTIQTQWIIKPIGGLLGLNYVAIESGMRMSGIKKKERPKIFDDLRIIEHTVLKIINERNEKQ